jgi:O-methyltransferase
VIFSTTVDEKRDSLIKLARSVADVPGEAAECGVFLGGCLRAIAEALPDKMVFGFDTFTGLPEEARGYGDLHPAGEFSATSIEVVRDNVAGLTNIILVPGIFPSRCEHLEHYSFAFVYLDFDFYVSTRDAISWFLPRMTPGGIMVFDDYDCDYCPGVRRAIEEAGIEIEHTVQTQVVHRS